MPVSCWTLPGTTFFECIIKQPMLHVSSNRNILAARLLRRTCSAYPPLSPSQPAMSDEEVIFGGTLLNFFAFFAFCDIIFSFFSHICLPLSPSVACRKVKSRNLWPGNRRPAASSGLVYSRDLPVFQHCTVLCPLGIPSDASPSDASHWALNKNISNPWIPWFYSIFSSLITYFLSHPLPKMPYFIQVSRYLALSPNQLSKQFCSQVVKKQNVARISPTNSFFR